MKRLFLTAILLNAGLFLTSFAQDNTKVGLPEGAIARLGKGGINIIRFSPDGTRLAVGTDIGVWLYDVPDGKETALFTGHTGQVNALAFSTDGKILASGGFANPIIQLWNLDTDSKLTTLKLTEKYGYASITALTFSEDNTRLISLDKRRGTITHYDVATGKRLSNKSKNVNSHMAVTISPDGTAFAKGKIYLSNSTPGKLLTSAFSSDGNMIANGGEDKTVHLWNILKPAKHATFKGHKAWITAVAFSADGKTVASGDANKIIKLWDVNARRERATLSGHKSTINALTFTPDNAPLYAGCLVSGSTDGTIRFWNPDTGEELVTFATGYIERVNALAFNEDGTTLTSADFNSVVTVWNLSTRQAVNTFTIGQGSAAKAIAFSPDVKQVVSLNTDSLMAAFNPHNSEFLLSFQGHSWIQLWELTTNEEIHGPWRNMDVDNSQEMPALSPHGILAVSSQEEIRAWHINTELELARFNTENWIPRGRMAFSSDSTKLALISPFSTPKVWDVPTQQEISLPNIRHVNAMAFSPDNATLALGVTENIYLCKLDTPTQDEPKAIRSNLHLFGEALTFSPDGSILVGTGKEDQDILIKLKLWDVETGHQVGTLTGHTESVTTLAFSRDGKTLASGSYDGTVLLWDWDKVIANRIPDNK